MMTAKGIITEEEERYVRYEQPKQISRRQSAATYYRDCDTESEITAETYNEEFDTGVVRNRAKADAERYTFPAQLTQEADDEALRPSVATMRTLNAENRAAASTVSRNETRQRVKINTRGKAIIAVYAAVLLAVIIAVIINAVAISSLSASVAGLENQLTSTTEQYRAAGNELSEVSYPDADSVPDDFVKVNSGNSVAVNVPKIDKTPQSTKSSNWFDAICEFISSIFGG